MEAEGRQLLGQLQEPAATHQGLEGLNTVVPGSDGRIKCPRHFRGGSTIKGLHALEETGRGISPSRIRHWVYQGHYGRGGWKRGLKENW